MAGKVGSERIESAGGRACGDHVLKFGRSFAGGNLLRGNAEWERAKCGQHAWQKSRSSAHAPSKHPLDSRGR